MVYNWVQFDAPGSRFTNDAVFVVTVAEPSEGDWITDAEMEEVAAEVRGTGDVAVTAFNTQVGRGASANAIGLLIDLAVGFTPSVVAVAWKRIKHRRPIMSVGALRYLCMADLAERLGVNSLDDVIDVVACDTVGARPSELNAVDIEPVLVVFVDSANTRSWVYLVSPRGHILSFHEGGPMNSMLSMYYGLPDPANEPPLLLGEDDPAPPGE